jgi:hypothetical protein
MIHLIIIRPGAGYSPQNNKAAFDECARKYGYSLETVGDSHLGHSYDRYPCVDVNGTRWGSGCAKTQPHHESFAEYTVAPLLQERILQGRNIVLIFGSRGGQVILPKLWKLGFDLPAIVINAGCARSEVRPPNPGKNLALISCSDDYFETKNPALVNGWIINNKRQDTAKVYVLPGQSHMPKLTADVINEWVKYCSITPNLAQLKANLDKAIERVNRDYDKMHTFAARIGPQQAQLIQRSRVGQLQQLHKTYRKKSGQFD